MEVLKDGIGFIKLSIALMLLPVISEGQTLYDLYSRPSKIISGNYTMNLFDVTLVVNTNAQNDTITLPPGLSAYSAANSEGLIYHIKNIGNNYVYLKPASGDSLEGSVLLFLISPGNASKQIQPSTSHSWFIH